MPAKNASVLLATLALLLLSCASQPVAEKAVQTPPGESGRVPASVISPYDLPIYQEANQSIEEGENEADSEASPETGALK